MEATSRHDFCCWLGRKASIETNKQIICQLPDVHEFSIFPLKAMKTKETKLIYFLNFALTGVN